MTEIIGGFELDHDWTPAQEEARHAEALAFLDLRSALAALAGDAQHVQFLASLDGAEPFVAAHPHFADTLRSLVTERAPQALAAWQHYLAAVARRTEITRLAIRPADSAPPPIGHA